MELSAWSREEWSDMGETGLTRLTCIPCRASKSKMATDVSSNVLPLLVAVPKFKGSRNKLKLKVFTLLLETDAVLLENPYYPETACQPLRH